jgi:hypothetical protein
MPASSTTETWDAAWTLTMRNKRKRLTDNIFDAYPTLRMFNAAAEVENGGKEIQEDIMYGKNSGTWFDGYDTVGTDAVDGITAAFFPWRYFAVPITISMTEEDENRKSDGAMRLLEAKTRQTMLTARDAINAAIYGAQSGKSMLGLQDLVADSPSTGTVGGINRATNAWWRNQNDATSTNVDNKTNDFYDGLTLMSSMWNSASEGNETPTDIFTTLTVFGDLQEIFESTGYARLQAGSVGTADAGSPSFRGATVRYDRDCSSGHMYMLNNQYIKMKIQANKNFAKTPFREPPNQFAKVAFVVIGIQITVNNPRRLVVASALT